jgi:hypothetical protein
MKTKKYIIVGVDWIEIGGKKYFKGNLVELDDKRANEPSIAKCIKLAETPKEPEAPKKKSKKKSKKMTSVKIDSEPIELIKEN